VQDDWKGVICLMAYGVKWMFLVSLGMKQCIKGNGEITRVKKVYINGKMKCVCIDE